MVSLDESQNAYEDEAWLEQSRAEIAARYASARRHTMLVRFLKYALPLASIVGVVAFFLVAYILPEGVPGFSASSIDLTSNSIVMQNPHVSGFLSGGRTYEIRADRAEQSLENTKVVTLSNIAATIGFGDGQSAKILARTGTYYSDKQRIVLTDKITLNTTTGITGELQSADIDMTAGTMTTDQPIDFQSQGSRIRAERVRVADKGERISFTNGVKVTYSVPDESKTKSAAPSR
ncbi:LPS export ABC transporter periplasmic protein LptC [Kaistia algarum]|uniref:LPS export ABC transporter periplasmic protein LptC n=1 Tax=Kaistia algarum TaxID=2083279 RepID=UPI000CE8AC1A|nr:LPS export ABC transporter periplasmic protein LptC [Kaistia algarum]MCX5513659.1 LPS export ABC transporter periplasmic protein LptC [Kaistia algarum]PPE79463.1 LPS export ABC transporter periplasmic protein LptC [Kaistia algarum]